MSEAIWIYTTTTPDHTFDIFEFCRMLNEMDTLELHELRQDCSDMELIHLRCFMRSEDNPADHKAVSRLFGKLARDIQRELDCRRNPSLRPTWKS